MCYLFSVSLGLDEDVYKNLSHYCCRPFIEVSFVHILFHGFLHIFTHLMSSTTEESISILVKQRTVKSIF